MSPKQLATATAVAASLALVGVPAFASNANSPAQDEQQTGMNNSYEQNASDMSGSPLSSVHNAKEQLASAPVKDAEGYTIGYVQNVRTSSGGKAQEVQISLTPRKRIATIPASDLRYDRATNTVTTSMSNGEIQGMTNNGSSNFAENGESNYAANEEQGIAPEGSSQSAQNGEQLSAAEGSPLSTVSNPEETLSAAPVKDMSGQTIGHVKNVTTSSNGDPQNVDVSLSGHQGLATIPASDLRYDHATNTVTTGMSRGEIEAMSNNGNNDNNNNGENGNGGNGP